MASGIYSVFKGNLMKKEVNLHTGGDTIYVTLLAGTPTFTAGDTVYTNATELATGGGYTQGADASNLLGSQAVTVAATTKWDAADKAWTSATFTAYGAVLWDATNSNSLICLFDFGAAKAVSSGTFTIVWHTDGILTLSS